MSNTGISIQTAIAQVEVLKLVNLLIQSERQKYPAGSMVDGKPVGGQWMPLDETGGGSATQKPGSSTATAPSQTATRSAPEIKPIAKSKEFQNLVEVLNKTDPATAEAFGELLTGPKVEKFQIEAAKAMTGVEPTKEALHAHHATPHGNGAVLGKLHGTKLETPVAGGIGLALDFMVTSINEQIAKLEDIEGATEQQQELANLVAKVAPLLCILFSNVAPEVLLGATLAKAGTIGLVQVAAVKATTTAAEKAMEELDIEDEAVKKAIEVVTMTATGMTAREGYMKVANRGAKVKAAASTGTYSAVIDKTRDFIAKGDINKARNTLRDGMPKSVNDAANAVSAGVIQALKPRQKAKT